MERLWVWCYFIIYSLRRCYLIKKALKSYYFFLNKGVLALCWLRYSSYCFCCYYLYFFKRYRYYAFCSSLTLLSCISSSCYLLLCYCYDYSRLIYSSSYSYLFLTALSLILCSSYCNFFTNSSAFLVY